MCRKTLPTSQPARFWSGSRQNTVRRQGCGGDTRIASPAGDFLRRGAVLLGEQMAKKQQRTGNKKRTRRRVSKNAEGITA